MAAVIGKDYCQGFGFSTYDQNYKQIGDLSWHQGFAKTKLKKPFFSL